MKNFYRAWGIGVLTLFAASITLGWSFASKRKVRDVPKSLRDNPGIYRSHYYGGK